MIEGVIALTIGAIVGIVLYYVLGFQSLNVKTDKHVPDSHSPSQPLWLTPVEWCRAFNRRREYTIPDKSAISIYHTAYRRKRS